MTLDGYFEGLNKDISWHNVDSEFNDFAVYQLNHASLLIFGRVTYELMAAYWPTKEAIEDDPVVAGKMNSLPKIVFSHSLTKVNWANTQLIKNNIEEECRRRKRESTKDIYIFGSAELSSALDRLELIDEYRIIINPVILGAGTPLFKSTDEPRKLKLIKTRIFNSGNVLLYYEREG
jgi:dihydrofolate reductase